MKLTRWSVAVVASLVAGAACAQQYPIVDKIAAKIVQNYEQSSCEQLYQQKMQKKEQPPSPGEQKAVELLRSDAGMRAEFFAKVATPIASKMFECGMIP